MARGKQATLAARRKYEASLDVVDRLTDKNADLKVRTRAVEMAAARVPTLEHRIADLERQVATSVTPVMEAERTAHAAVVAELTKKLDLACGYIETLMDANCHWAQFQIPEKLVTQADYLGVVFRNKRLAPNRAHRRAQEFRSTVGDRNELGDQDDPLGANSRAMLTSGPANRRRARQLINASES